MRPRWWQLLALVLVLALGAAACGNDDEEDAEGADSTADSAETDEGDDITDDAGTDDATTGDTTTTTSAVEASDTGDDGEVAARCDATVPGTLIDYAPFVPTASFDPPYSSGTIVGGTELAAFYDVLMRYDVDTGEYHAQLAESLEPNEDFTVWTLTLRDGITYGDGTPLDADMVLANIDRYFEPVADQRIINTSPPFLQFIADSNKLDDLTIEFTLSQPWSGFPYVFNREPGMIVNTNAIGDDPVAFGADPPPEAGVGPYVVERNAPGEEIVLTARADYWDGPVCIETLRMNVAASTAFTGSAAGWEAFQTGDVDIAFLREASVIEEARAAGAQALMDYQDAGTALIFNVRPDAPLSDPALREAAALAIDPQVINERAYGGELDVGKAFILDSSPRYSDAVESMATDPEAAGEVLAGTGFTGTLGLLCSNGPAAVETALATEAMLESVGFTVETETIGTLDQIARMATGDYDVSCWGINSAGDTAVPAYVRNLHSESPVNRQGYADAEMDRLLAEAMAAPPEDLSAALAAINNEYVAQFLGVPFGAVEEGIVISDEIAGVKQTGSTIFLFDDAYIVE